MGLASGRSDPPRTGFRPTGCELPRRRMMHVAQEQKASWFQRFLLPGFAFKAVVIGGGYATGRELAEFFLPSGPRGGLAGMLLAMLLGIWNASDAWRRAY